MVDDKYDLITDPGMIEKLETTEGARKLYVQLQALTRKVNELTQVPFPPTVLNFSVDFSGASAVRCSLKWDDVPLEMLKWVDGVRIWKVDTADGDDNSDLNKNEKAQVLISSIRTTNYVDLDVTNGRTYIYWIQWINTAGVVGPVSGGITGTVGTSTVVAGGPTREPGGGGGAGTYGTARGDRGGARRGMLR
jgi:hypothetical protein